MFDAETHKLGQQIIQQANAVSNTDELLTWCEAHKRIVEERVRADRANATNGDRIIHKIGRLANDLARAFCPPDLVERLPVVPIHFPHLYDRPKTLTVLEAVICWAKANKTQARYDPRQSEPRTLAELMRHAVVWDTAQRNGWPNPASLDSAPLGALDAWSKRAFGKSILGNVEAVNRLIGECAGRKRIVPTEAEKLTVHDVAELLELLPATGTATTHLRQAHGWLLARFIERQKQHNFGKVYTAKGEHQASEAESVFAAIPVEEFHAFLISITADLAVVLEECEQRGWIRFAKGGFNPSKMRPFYHVLPEVQRPIDSNPPKQVEASGRRKRIPKAVAEVLVREWFIENAKKVKEDPHSVRRDDIANETGVSEGGVSGTSTWIAFEAKRKEQTKPGARNIPLSDRIKVNLTNGALGKAERSQRDAVVNALIAEQEAEEKEENRRHERRHDGN